MEQLLGYSPGEDRSGAYAADAPKDKSFFTVFTMFDNQYDSIITTPGQHRPHPWHMTGQVQATYIDVNQKRSTVCAASKDWGNAEGTLSFGPYERLSGGRYRAVFQMFGIFAADVASGAVVAHIDICTGIGQNVLAHRALTKADFRGTLLDFPLEVESSQGFDNIEVRIYYCGIGAVGYRTITLYHL